MAARLRAARAAPARLALACTGRYARAVSKPCTAIVIRADRLRASAALPADVALAGVRRVGAHVAAAVHAAVSRARRPTAEACRLVASSASPSLLASESAGACARAVATAALWANGLIADGARITREALTARGGALAVPTAPKAPAADCVKRIGAIVTKLAARAAPSVEARAHAGRRARPVPMATRLALRLAAVVPAPACIAAALAWTRTNTVSRAAVGTLRHTARLAAPPLEACASPGRVAAAACAAVAGARWRPAFDSAPPISARAHAGLRASAAPVGLSAVLDTAI